MIGTLKYIFGLGAFLALSWMSWGFYTYFVDRSQPHVVVYGLEEDSFYSGDLTCQIETDKAGELSITLDNQSIISHFKINKTAKGHPFTIPTKTIANGPHQLKIELVDSSYHKNKTVLQKQFHVDNSPLQAAFVKSDAEYKVFQGRTLHVQFQINKPVKEAKVHALANTYECFQESPKSNIYECFIPIACEETPNEYLLSLEVSDHVGNSLSLDNKFQIVMYPFKKQILTLSAETVKREKEIELTMNDLETILQDIAYKSPKEKLWKGNFCTPIDVSKVTCEFGTIRTTQQKGRYMHKALDVINAPKSVVWATQDGIVAVKDRFAVSGNTVVIDHGYGVVSLFFHLDEFADIKVGQKVAKGNPIGTLGKTGYATGYHLHWEMRVNNVAIDPMQWTKASF